MPKNPFARNGGKMPSIKRNLFDMSKHHLFTSDFGLIKPTLCLEVLPGDSFKIDSQLAIQAFPTVFPLQTRVRVDVHFFYIRNRIVYKDFEDFVFNTKEGLTRPYLDLSLDEDTMDMFSVGGLAHSLGVPVTYAGSHLLTRELQPTNNVLFVGSKSSVQTVGSTSELTSLVNVSLSGVSTIGFVKSSYDDMKFIFNYIGIINEPLVEKKLYYSTGTTLGTSSRIVLVVDGVIKFILNGTTNTKTINNRVYYEFTVTDSAYEYVNNIVSQGKSVFCYFTYAENSPSNTSFTSTTFIYPDTINLSRYSFAYGYTRYDYSSIFDNPNVLTDCPYFNGDIHILAEPFRAYESVCNYYYRNDLNNPYVVNGQVQYNQFIPTADGGPDSNYYKLHHRNWELDRFTSAVQSPQFGIAPLVGITVSPTTLNQENVNIADLTFKSEDETPYHVKAVVDGDDNIVSVVDFDKDIPSGSLRQVIDAAANGNKVSDFGISINDLRNVNSFQRFLENTLRRGLRYRNQMQSHFGVNVDYPDIDVPEFIGGYSGYLNVDKKTSLGGSDSLGDFVGTLQGLVQGKHQISKYCPEHGYIMCMVSISPRPYYSQTLDRMFMRYSPFDMFQSEFSKIGHVPIFDSEVAPLQTLDVDHVFGYQKAWYEYMSSLDQVSGLFTTSLKDWVLTRVFDSAPDLSDDFTRIYKDQLNDVWSTSNMVEEYGKGDKFMCNMFFDIASRRPIPRNGVPSLE